MSLFKSVGTFLLVAAFLFYEMGVQVSPGVMTHHLMRDLGTTALGLSWVSGAYFITYTLMQIPAGLIYDRFHVRQVIILPILMCALGSFGFSIAGDISTALYSRMFMGLGSAFAFIAVLVVASDLFPAKYFAFIAGITQLLAAFGALCGEVPVVWAIEHMGWRETMSQIAIIGVVLAVLIFAFVRYPKSNLQRKFEFKHIMQSLKEICSSKQTWYLAVYACLLWAPMATFASLWGVPFVKHSMMISQEDAASIVSMMWLGIAFGSPLIGWASDFLETRKGLLVFVGLFGALSMGLSILAIHDLTQGMLKVCLFLSGAACSGQVLSFAVVKDNNQARNNAAAIGFNNMGVVLAGFIFQPLAGKLIQHHWRGAMIDSIPYYRTSDYRAGLIIIPIVFLIGGLIAAFKIEESYPEA